jgi:UDP-N-acetylglucosamine--N-acetylmuramyl-(pentapeptide) pyrophosphoryl-undecaprenol N-acetylglucosamine transferase
VIRSKAGKKLRVLLTGGGTGGHVYPLLAIYRMIRKELNINRALYVGARGRAEKDIVPRSDVPLRFVTTAAISGHSPWHWILSVFKNMVGTLEAVLILLRFRPHLILASGGYVSAPVCFASFLLRPFLSAPLVIDEQNVMPGLMNKVASLFARVVMVSFPETPYFLWNNRCVYTGYPVREEILEAREQRACRRDLGIPDGHTVLLVYGGSLGSRSINRLLMGVFSEMLTWQHPLFIIHSTGLTRGEYMAWEETRRLLEAALPVGTNVTASSEGIETALSGGRLVYRLQPYLHNLLDYLAACDLVVCRAGAGTISEIAASGKASIVIPKRGLPGDHQEHNAIRLAESRGCEVLFERKGHDGVDFVDPGDFLLILKALLSNPEQISALGKNARLRFNRHFRERIVRTIQDVLARHEIDYVSNIVEPPSVRILKQVDLLVDFLRRQPPDSFYRRLYNIKMDEYLSAGRWTVVNNGIKLAGALHRLDRVPDLIRWYDLGNGFMRRNVLRALDHMDRYVEALPDLLLRALDDSYFEVRATALAVAGKYASYLLSNEGLITRMKEVVGRRFQHFDVRLQGLRVLPRFLPLRDYLRIAKPFRFAENARLRQAILEGLRMALEAGRFSEADMDLARRFINEMPVTTSDFSPQFAIRDSFVVLYRALSEKEHSKEERQP